VEGGLSSVQKQTFKLKCFYRFIQPSLGVSHARSQLQRHQRHILQTGFFQNVKATPSDTPLKSGLPLRCNPTPGLLKSVQPEGARIVPEKVVSDILPTNMAPRQPAASWFCTATDQVVSR
jgi:hypothetical protein